MQLNDPPAVGLSGNAATVQTTQQYKTYLMYQPPGSGSIWVVIEMLQWNWAGTAQQGSPWSVVTGSASYSAGTTANPIAGADCSGLACISLPTWTDYTSDPNRQ